MPEVEWIDSEGQSRIHHDDNYQMIMKHGEDDSLWLIMDSWDMYFAAKVIVIGYTENIQEHIDFLSRQSNRIGNDRADIMIKILNRFNTLAQSAINADVLQKHDTPKNWLAWAQSKVKCSEVMLDIEPSDHGLKTRSSELYELIWRVHEFLNKIKKPTAQQVWNEIHLRHKEHDIHNIIQEVDGRQILWCSGYGNEQKLQRTTFNKTLSNIRKNRLFGKTYP
jgi:hypothetical protein